MEIEKGNGTGVCVLLSAYKPDLKFFAAQLDSIDEQTFPVTLLVRNDCPESASLEGFIQEHIKKNLIVNAALCFQESCSLLNECMISLSGWRSVGYEKKGLS